MNGKFLIGWKRRRTIACVVVALVLATGLVIFFAARRKEDPSALWKVAREATGEAQVLLDSNKLDEAESASRRALRALEKLLAWWPRERRIRHERASALDVLAQALAAGDRPEEAADLYRDETSVWANLIAEQPASLEERYRLAECLDRAGTLLRAIGRWESADVTFNRGRRLCEDVPNAIAGDPQVQRYRANFLRQLAFLLWDLGRRSEALARHEQAVRVQRSVVESPAGVRDDRERLVSLLINLAAARLESRRRADAERAIVEARELSFGLCKDDPSVARYQDLAASVLQRHGAMLQADPQRRLEARDAFERAVAIFERLVSASPSSPDELSKLATACGSLASLHRDLQAFDLAEALYRKELSYRASLVRDRPRSLPFRFAHGRALHELADLLRERSRGPEALALEQEAVKQLGSVYRQNVRDPDYRRAVSCACWELAAIELDRKDYKAAAQAVASYLEIEPSGYEESLESSRFLCRCALLCRADTKLAVKDREALAKSYTDRALSALSAAVHSGYRDTKDLKTSPTYDLLRTREDFKELLREVEARVEELSHD